MLYDKLHSFNLCMNIYSVRIHMYMYMYNVCVYAYRLQKERMAVIEGMLKQREADHQALNERRLEHLW